MEELMMEVITIYQMSFAPTWYWTRKNVKIQE